MEHRSFVPIEGREPDSNTDESEILIEPEVTRSLSESLEKGKADFSALLKTVDIRSLVQYLTLAGARIDDLTDLPEMLRKRFVTPEFQTLPYTWRNPRLYLLANRHVVQLALDELLSRVRSRDMSLQEL